MARSAEEILNTAIGNAGSIDPDTDMWTLNYRRVLPIVMQQWPPSGVVPALFYLLRWNHRRGSGKFQEVFHQKGVSKGATVEQVAKVLAEHTEGWLTGFDRPVDRDVLADLMLACCVETVRREPGRDKVVHRVLPTHFFASWVDLPPRSQMRDVPETLAAVLGRPEGEGVQPFPLGCPVAENRLLAAFGTGVTTDTDSKKGLAADEFSESSDGGADSVGIDQLLTIRIAQSCGVPPSPPRGDTSHILTHQPLAGRSARIIREDLAALVEGYASCAPRQVLMTMVESCLGLGMSNLLLTTAAMLRHWEQTGEVLSSDKQNPIPCFVDCSSSADRELRRLAEDSFATMFRQLERLPVHFAALRLLTVIVLRTPRATREEKDLADPTKHPDVTAWLQLLGQVACGAHQKLSGSVQDRIGEFASAVASGLEAEGLCPAAVDLFRTVTSPTPEGEWIWRAAEATVLVLEEGPGPRGSLIKVLRGCLLADEPQGWARTRQAQVTTASGKRIGEARSIVFSNSGLDFLVHRHLWENSQVRPISYAAFLRRLRDRYGLYIAESPPGTSIAQELLLRNSDLLQRRLRDLGVLTGVNDAESMKRLRPRFTSQST